LPIVEDDVPVEVDVWVMVLELALHRWLETLPSDPYPTGRPEHVQNA
jgi:hypothetical protein